MKTAFEILQEHHNYVQHNGEKLSEYQEDNILKAMEEYLQQYKDSLNPVDQPNFASEPIETINEGGENREEK